MYKIINLDNQSEWRDIIESFKDTDIYSSLGYVQTFYENGDGKPELFYFENDYGRVANVFLLRDLYADKRLAVNINENNYFDITTAYGYGGPIFEATDLEKLRENYLKVFGKVCRELNIISEFIRFHPIIKNHIFLDTAYDVKSTRKTIFMDLSNGEEMVWRDFESNNRRNILKAQRSGIDIIHGKDKYLIEEFKRLYIKTMKRDNANQYYFFNDNFFFSTVEKLKDNSVIFAAVYEKKIIASSIILFSKDLIHYHLGGSDEDYLNLRPNNLLLYEVARWGCIEGKKIFHLGGGVNGDGDNLFRFKRSFSKTNSLNFYLGKNIHNENVYEKLVKFRIDNDRSFDINTNYFPKYRG